jgi:hypothetical protein
MLARLALLRAAHIHLCIHHRVQAQAVQIQIAQSEIFGLLMQLTQQQQSVHRSFTYQQ